MPLRTRITLILATVFVVFAGVIYAVHRAVVLPSFHELEAAAAANDISRGTAALENEVEHLRVFCNDWSNWDDTYEFVGGENATFVEDNLAAETFADADLALLYFVRTDGTVHWGDARVGDDAESIVLPEFPTDRWPTSHPLLQLTDDEDHVVSGVIATSAGPMLVSSNPILPTEGDAPRRGALVMGRLIDDELAASIARLAGLPLRIHDVSRSQDDLDSGLVRRVMDAPEPLLVERDRHRLDAYAMVEDIHGEPLLLLEGRLPREILARGEAVTTLAVFTVLGSGFVSALVLVLALQHAIVRPLTCVTEHADAIGDRDDLSARLSLDRTDEIGKLAGAFDHMVAQLEDSRLAAAAASRHAGMAEVAQGVIHDVGNALNSASVAVGTLRERAAVSRVGRLRQLVELLDEHESDLGRFLTEDERGRQVPGYLKQLAGHLEHEQGSVSEELSTIGRSIDHAVEIIRAQQRFTRGPRHLERLSITTLLDDAVAITAASRDRHSISIDASVDDTPFVNGDRAQLMQVLVNLLVNAKQSIVESGRDRGSIRLSARQDRDRVAVAVEDDGGGITAANLERIFAQGYTTRAEGTGIGLHQSANIAKEAGGSLLAFSDGVDRGARFVLDLPAADELQGRVAA